MKATVARGQRALTEAVSAARRQGVDADAVARLQRRVLTETSAASSAHTGLSGAPARVGVKALAGGALLLVGGLSLGLQHAANDASKARPRSPTVAAEGAPAASLPAATSSSPAALPEDPGDVASAAPHENTASEAKPPRARRAPAAPASSTPLPAPGPEAELVLLRRALAALPSRPALALSLTDQHAREHPRGVFAQEREAIAIDAFLALQRTAAAEARVRRFLADHPRSPHAPRLRAVLGPQDRAPAPTHPQAPTIVRQRESV
jgi:hypothetical protein